MQWKPGSRSITMGIEIRRKGPIGRFRKGVKDSHVSAMAIIIRCNFEVLSRGKYTIYVRDSFFKNYHISLSIRFPRIIRIPLQTTEKINIKDPSLLHCTLSLILSNPQHYRCFRCPGYVYPSTMATIPPATQKKRSCDFSGVHKSSEWHPIVLWYFVRTMA